MFCLYRPVDFRIVCSTSVEEFVTFRCLLLKLIKGKIIVERLFDRVFQEIFQLLNFEFFIELLDFEFCY